MFNTGDRIWYSPAESWSTVIVDIASIKIESGSVKELTLRDRWSEFVMSGAEFSRAIKADELGLCRLS